MTLMPNLCLNQLLAAQVNRNPEANAITAPGRTPLTYRQLNHHINHVVATLNTLGVGRNDRIAIVLPNGPEMALAFLAVAAGATAAPLNPAYRADEFDFYLSDIKAKALIIQAGVFEPARAVARAHGIQIIELQPVLKAEAGIFTLTPASTGDARPKSGGFAQPDDVALVLHTSGTTSRPKIVPLTQSNLYTSAHNISATLALTENDRCLNVMPLFHIHGLIGGLLSSLTVGASVVCTPGFYAPKFFEWFQAFGPTWYSAVPTMHQAILARASTHREIIARTQLRFIRSSSAALPPQVLADLENVFNAPVIEAYGMTEASHQMASNPLPPRQRQPGSVGMAAGPEIAIMDEAGHLLSSGTLGEIVIRGANVTRGYENNPKANQSAFTNGWFRTGDQGYLDSDGYLFITGRLKEIINRGGEKISPREVDEILMDHPAVAQVVTFAMPHSQLGEEIAAAVVLHENATDTTKDIQAFAAARLADFKVPRQIIILDEIPKGPTGKLQRIGLADKLGLTASEPATATAEFVAPTTPIEEKLATIWSEVLNVEPVGIHDNFFQLGGDSILVAQVIARVRKVLQVELSFLIFFETPTVAAIAKHVETADKTAPAQPSIQPIPKTGELPLSFSQQRMWFLDQLDPGSPAYNRPSSIRLTGQLNVAALEKSLNEIVRRHEVLRTHFPMINGTAIQVIASNLILRLSVTDLSDWPDRETEAQRLAASEAQRGFDLAQGPLIRAGLLRLNQEVHVLLLTMHHIVFDGWSMGVLLRELAALYEAFGTGKPSSLAKLPVQYVDFAHWQRQWLQGETLNTQLYYWKQKLADITVLNLPTVRPRPAVQTFQGGRQSLVLSKGLSDSLKALSQRENVTLFMTLLAAFQTLLHRYTGQDDIIVGSPIAGRHLVETEKLIGVFINTLVLRTDLSGNPTFQTLLARVRETALGAYAHQTLPFEKLVEEIQPERDLSRTPLFQVLFQLRNIPNETVEVQELRMDEFEFDTGVTRLDLALDMVDKPEGLSCVLMYNVVLFDGDTIRRMAGHFQTLLEGIVASPNQKLSELPLLTEVEQHKLLVEWNNTQREYPQDTCIHQLFEAQVERTPDAVAVRLEDRQLTYGELNNRANQLAHYLQSLGVKPEVLVGICVERSLEMVIGLLGILKAGGAYLPLDPAYPAARLAFMLEDTGVGVLLTQSSLVSILPKTTVQVVCLDTERKTLSRLSTDNLASGVAPSNLAYVIYTSGSTGKPKGVMILHHSIADHCRVVQSYYQLVSSDRVLQFASLNFDASLEQIFSTLITGARLILRGSQIWTIADFSHQIVKNGITVVNLPPAYWQQWLKESANLPEFVLNNSLKLVIVGGDVMLPEMLHSWQQTPMNSIRLINAYGPTEATITTTTFEITSQFDGKTHHQRIPIGRPLANKTVYILDTYNNPVPIGVPGELHIGGAGLARGYFNRPELTAEKFIPNPFSDDPESRLYKTGDLARYLPDGNIEYLGRIDNQVKIRGFRIELGEIEAVLAQHPTVQKNAVIVLEKSFHNKRLVAYLIPNKDQIIETIELRRFLQEKLPDYMIPSALVPIEAMPLTPNGKIDRRALPTPDQTRDDLEETFVAPRTPIEERLAGIWAEVLHREPIGSYDNFFELGGHSLLATQVISRISEAFAVDIPLRSLFETPTVAGLAERVILRLTVAHDKMGELLAELEGLSEDEAQRLIGNL